MFCTKCGEKIEGDARFCSNCGTMQVNPVRVEGQKNVISNSYEGKTSKKESKKKFKLFARIVLAIVVIVSIMLVIFLWLNGKGYEKEVKNYLDYFADECDDAEGYISVAYMGGGFGSVVNTKDAVGVHQTLYEALADQIDDEDSHFSYASSDVDSWEDVVEDMRLKSYYLMMDETFGKGWELSYEIVESEKMSESQAKRLDDKLEDCIESYEETLDSGEQVGLDSDGEEIFEDFIDSLSDKEIKKAYKVKVEIEIDGDESSLEDTYTFKVAKIGREWVILEGPSLFEFCEDAED